MDKAINEQFRNYLKNKIDESGYSLRKIGRKTGLDHSYLSRVLSGEFKTPSPDKLKNISKYLPCSYTELMIKAGYLSEDNLNYLVDEENVLKVPVLKNNILNNKKLKEIFIEDNNVNPKYIEDTRLYINTTQNQNNKFLYLKVEENFITDNSVSEDDLILICINRGDFEKGDLVVALKDKNVFISHIIYKSEKKYLLQTRINKEPSEVTNSNILGKVLRIEFE